MQGAGLSGALNTAFVERVNVTLRRGVAALARRTWATAQEAPQLLAHREWWRGYYHVVRPHASLRVVIIVQYICLVKVDILSLLIIVLWIIPSDCKGTVLKKAC